MDAKKLIELRKQAEKAVQDMPDSEFKLKAFEVILNHLLAPGKAQLTSELQSERHQSTKSSLTKTEEADAKSTQGRILVLKLKVSSRNHRQLVTPGQTGSARLALRRNNA